MCRYTKEDVTAAYFAVIDAHRAAQHKQRAVDSAPRATAPYRAAVADYRAACAELATLKDAYTAMLRANVVAA